jgi:hypothetical protein
MATLLFTFNFLPAFAEATGVNPWMNTKRVSAEAAPSPKRLWRVGDLAKADTLRRVTPKSCGGHGCKAVGLHGSRITVHSA